ncbi:MAG TPA: DUF1491 family protein [Devosiaceae bacterium]|jgi:hypothetical protein|nr:DUF1491 family protein [Devosiaceae bacterium]
MLRTDLWAAAFVRRHNDLGHLCVISRRGDPIAGQIFLELDHLDGTASLFVPAPTAARHDDGAARVFQRRFAAVSPQKIRERLAQEERFDPDFWLISLEMRGSEIGIEVVP